jgi:PIN domain nuclease of toxin-antitoxin system
VVSTDARAPAGPDDRIVVNSALYHDATAVTMDETAIVREHRRRDARFAA